MRKRFRLLLALSGATGVALLVAAHLPEMPGFWFDEAFTANQATFRAGILEVVGRTATGDAHPPLFYVLAVAWAKLVGIWGSAVGGLPPLLEEKARLMNVLLGTLLTLPLMFLNPASFFLLWGSEHWLGKVYEWRMYPLLGGLWGLAYLGLYRRQAALLGVASLLALYTHYLSLLVVPILYAHLLLFPWRVSRREGLLLASPLLFLPWLPFLVRLVLSGAANASLRPDPVVALDVLRYLGLPLGEPETLEFFGYLLSALAVGVGGWLVLVRKEYAKGTGILVPFAAVLVWYGASLVLNVTSPRYIGAFLPMVALSLAFALEALPQGAGRGVRWAVFLASLLPLSTLFWYKGHLVPDEGFPRMAALLQATERRYGPGLVLGDEGGRLMTLRYYFRGRSDLMLVGRVSPKEAAEGRPWVALLLYGPMASTEGGARMAEAARILRKRCPEVRLLSFEGTKLLFHLCSPPSFKGTRSLSYTLPRGAFASHR